MQNYKPIGICRPLEIEHLLEALEKAAWEAVHLAKHFAFGNIIISIAYSYRNCYKSPSRSSWHCFQNSDSMSNCKNNMDFSKDFPSIFITFYLLHCCNAQTAREFPNKEGDAISVPSSSESKKDRRMKSKRKGTWLLSQTFEVNKCSHPWMQILWWCFKKYIYIKKSECLKMGQTVEADVIIVKNKGKMLQLSSPNLHVQSVID